MQESRGGSAVAATSPTRWFTRTAVALATGAGLMLAASHAHAVIVYSGTVNLTIPATTNGLYLNVVTGATNLPGSTGGATVPGWDINPWSSSGLGFFSPSSMVGGSYVLSSASTTANLAPGASIGGSSTFGTGSSFNTSQWLLNSSNNLFGFRFTDENTGSLHYGWGRISLSSTIAGSRALVEYAYESTPGLAIQAGVVPEPSTFAMLGLGVAGLLAARRRFAR